MEIKEIEAKSILTKSNLPEADYCINPYVGCLHKCVYCYARFMRRFTSHTEPWGEFVDIKVNAVELLKKKMRSRSKLEGTVLLGSVTDAYQPLERKYKITRGLLKEFLNSQMKVSILTKSSLILRDIDILKQLKNVTVGITITTTNDAAAKKIEPNASLIKERLKTLDELNKNGIYTYAFIGPIMPKITDLENIFRKISSSTSEVWGEILNVRSGNWNDIQKCLKENF